MSSPICKLYRRDGAFEFNPARHDFGSKTLLGHTIDGMGFGEVEQAIKLIAAAIPLLLSPTRCRCPLRGR